MSVIKEMDPGLALKLIEGYENVLAPEAEAHETLYSSFRCPRCKCSLQKELDPRHAWNDDNLVPRALLRCANCKYLIDPFTNVVVNFGDASKIPVESIPILGQK